MQRYESNADNAKRSISRKINVLSEQGSALVLVMFIVLLLTILGVSVLGAAVGGARLTETRESDVQSLHLAQKTIDEALAYITAELNNKIQNSSTMTQDEIDDYISRFLESLNDNKDEFVATTDFQGATNGITDFSVEEDPINGEQKVTITANATINGVLRTLQQKIVITTFPDFLNYSLGSEGTVYLNGSPEIDGNIYAGVKLKLSKVANYVHNTKLPQTSQFPKIDGEAQVQSMKNIEYSENGKDYTLITEVPTGVTLDKRVKEISEGAVIKKKSTFVQINVEDSFLDKVTEATNALGKKGEYSNIYYGSTGGDGNESATIRGKRLITSLQATGVGMPTLKQPLLADYDGIKSPTDPKKDATDEEKQQLYEEALQQLKSDLSGLSVSTIFNGSLELNGVDFDRIVDTDKTGSQSSSNWFIVNGDLTLDNYASQAIKVQSNILVTGNLYIKGDVSFDSTMFVLGKTEVVNATVTGIDQKELVLISKGSILINRVEEFKDTATVLRAFFYTDSTAELYGVGSIFSLDGGFFAKGDLIINAVVGKVGLKEGYDEFNFDPQTESADPRFIVHYNKNVFEDQKIGLPRINQVNIKVGPIELLQPGS
ncbi:hypothetical protein [Paenibacillus sp. sgz500958]|uniref:hypothetical protein n=1 Tax=Paenibacillus sp. sgz500958 TaxID=3242475 RepID=UPI0036D29100